MELLHCVYFGPRKKALLLMVSLCLVLSYLLLYWFIEYSCLRQTTLHKWGGGWGLFCCAARMQDSFRFPVDLSSVGFSKVTTTISEGESRWFRIYSAHMNQQRAL